MQLSPAGYAVAALSALSLGVLGPEVGEAAREVDGIDFDRSLAAGATLLLVAVSGWWLACIGLALASEWAAARVLARLVTPRFVRRALFVGAAGALAIGPVSAVSDHGRDSAARSVTGRSLDGLHLPDRPVGARPAVPARQRPHVIHVRPGDTLWSIASRHLGAGANAAEICAAVEAWYDTNRARIGADPDLILPRLRLTVPAKDSR